MPSKYNKRPSKANYGRSNEFSYESGPDSLEHKDFVWYDFPFTIICSIFLVVIHFLFFILAPTDIVFSIPNRFVELFAQNNQVIVSSGISSWYRFVTSIFIHGNIVHLGGNLLFFVIFSLRLEELKGWKVTAIIFLISGLFGNLLTFVLLWNVDMWSLGASGAVMGVFMADLVTMRKTYDKGSMTMLAFLVVFGSLFIGGSAQTNFLAHFGGLLGGAIAMLLVEKYEKSKRKLISRR